VEADSLLQWVDCFLRKGFNHGAAGERMLSPALFKVFKNGLEKKKNEWAAKVCW